MNFSDPSGHSNHESENEVGLIFEGDVFEIRTKINFFVIFVIFAIFGWTVGGVRVLRTR